MIACGTKILAPVLSVTGINRVQCTGAACTSARRLLTSKATMWGLKPSPDWTWSHWLWLVGRQATSVVQWGALERRFANATSVHGAVSANTFFFFLHNRSSSISNIHCEIQNNKYRRILFMYFLNMHTLNKRDLLKASSVFADSALHPPVVHRGSMVFGRWTWRWVQVFLFALLAA